MKHLFMVGYVMSLFRAYHFDYKCCGKEDYSDRGPEGQSRTCGFHVISVFTGLHQLDACRVHFIPTLQKNSGNKVETGDYYKRRYTYDALTLKCALRQPIVFCWLNLEKFSWN